jgi:hypothetical protein
MRFDHIDLPVPDAPGDGAIKSCQDLQNLTIQVDAIGTVSLEVMVSVNGVTFYPITTAITTNGIAGTWYMSLKAIFVRRGAGAGDPIVTAGGYNGREG